MTSRTPRRVVFAWLVHLYTAFGLVCAAAIAVLIVRGGEQSFRLAFLFMMIATAIDATDGWLARRAHVKEILPSFDGRALDDLIDFHTYTSLPLLLVWRADLLPGAFAWLLLFPLLASAYGFSRTDAKTDDGFFLGFPSYWNITAFYLFALRPAPVVVAAVLVTFAVLTFVRTPYLYATRGGPYARTMNVGAAIWFVMLALILFGPDQFHRPLTVVSSIYPLTYLGLSARVAWTRRNNNLGNRALP